MGIAWSQEREEEEGGVVRVVRRSHERIIGKRGRR